MNSTTVQYNPNFEKQFKEYIEAHAESMFFQSNAYIKLMAELLNAQEEHILFLKDNQIKGIFPLLSKSGCFGKVYNSLPYYGSNGCSLADNEEIENALLEQYNVLINQPGVAASTCVENPLKKRNVKNLISHNETDYRIGQFTKIGYTENHAEKLMESFHYKSRNMIRKGMKSDLRIEVDNDAMDFLIQTHKDNMKAIGGKAKPQLFFELIKKYFKPNSDYKIWIAYNGDVKVAALLLFYYRDIVEYYSPVILEQYRDKQPLSYLIYEAMIEASQREYTLWNWGGTWASQGGVYGFKKRWGTFDQNYEYYIQINNQEIYNSSKETLLKEYPDFFVLPFNKLK